MFKKFFMSAMALAVISIFSPSAASAAPFTGQIDYVGTHTANNADLDLATQSSISFALVLIADGSFGAAGIGAGDFLVHAPTLVYRPSGAPYAPLWSHAGSGVSFALNSLNIVFSSDDQLNLTGQGVFSGGGFDATIGTWNMTINTAGRVNGTYSSSGSIPRDVPEPVAVSMLGLGLLGAGIARRRQRVS